MIRYILSDLLSWTKETRRKPLLLRGARQVGKTWLVDQLAQQAFNHYIKIDFEEDPELISLFSGDLNPQRICSELEIRTGIDIIEKKTLLFLMKSRSVPGPLWPFAISLKKSLVYMLLQQDHC